MTDLFDIAVITLAAGLSAAAAVAWSMRPAMADPGADAEPIGLLFRDGLLQHATRSAVRELGLVPGFDDWHDLRDALRRRFPALPELVDLGASGHRVLHGDDTTLGRIDLRWRDAHCWVTVSQDDAALPVTPQADPWFEICDALPHPVWIEDAAGAVRFHNPAFASLIGKDGTTSPFGPCDTQAPVRKSLPGDTASWYEVTARTGVRGTICHATPIDELVKAEDAQRTFVQTLAKTFAHLSTGLAIFDRTQRLVLFNPALVDLSALPVPFLSGRPTMMSFFDQLRECRRMPEPRNYRSWREEIAEVIAQATDGRYEETWALETGQTYRVRGRQHPDGATALLIEDISAEMAMTRNFRAELEQAQTLIDSVDDAMATFSVTGVLTFSNAAYRTLWKIDPETAFADITLHDCLQAWRQESDALTNWTPASHFVDGSVSRPPEAFELSLRTGERLECMITAIPSGSTLVRFRTLSGAQADPVG